MIVHYGTAVLGASSSTLMIMPLLGDDCCRRIRCYLGPGGGTLAEVGISNGIERAIAFSRVHRMRV